MKYTIIVLLALLIMALHPAPVGKLVGDEVHVVPDVAFYYAPIDGSFIAFKYVAGCLPWRSCAINEPTDWWIVLR